MNVEEKKKWFKPRKCINCRRIYKEIDNLSQHKCRFHSGFIYRNKYDCCGKSKTSPGCIIQDHFDCCFPNYVLKLSVESKHNPIFKRLEKVVSKNKGLVKYKNNFVYCKRNR